MRTINGQALLMRSLQQPPVIQTASLESPSGLRASVTRGCSSPARTSASSTPSVALKSQTYADEITGA